MSDIGCNGGSNSSQAHEGVEASNHLRQVSDGHALRHCCTSCATDSHRTCGTGRVFDVSDSICTAGVWGTLGLKLKQQVRLIGIWTFE